MLLYHLEIQQRYYVWLHRTNENVVSSVVIYNLHTMCRAITEQCGFDPSKWCLRLSFKSPLLALLCYDLIGRENGGGGGGGGGGSGDAPALIMQNENNIIYMKFLFNCTCIFLRREGMWVSSEKSFDLHKVENLMMRSSRHHKQFMRTEPLILTIAGIGQIQCSKQKR